VPPEAGTRPPCPQSLLIEGTCQMTCDTTDPMGLSVITIQPRHGLGADNGDEVFEKYPHRLAAEGLVAGEVRLSTWRHGAALGEVPLGSGTTHLPRHLPKGNHFIAPVDTRLNVIARPAARITPYRFVTYSTSATFIMPYAFMRMPTRSTNDDGGHRRRQAVTFNCRAGAGQDLPNDLTEGSDTPAKHILSDSPLP
jgi:hypothetical protein